MIDIPDGVNAADFVLSGGRLRAARLADEPKEKATTLKLREFLDRFLDSIPDNSLEQSTLETMRIHQRHLIRVLGPGFAVGQLSLPDLQGYVNKRAKEKT